jgi:bacterioferritin
VSRRAVDCLSERIRQSDALGEIGLKVNLETQVSDETRHKEEIERILVGWG